MAYRLGVHIRLLTRCHICFILGQFANYFSSKSFRLSLKSVLIGASLLALAKFIAELSREARAAEHHG